VLILEIPDKYQGTVALMRELGCEVTCEQLSTGEAAQYITHAEGEVDIRITPCGEAADIILLEMLDAFTRDSFHKWLKEVQEEVSVGGTAQ